MRFIDLFAGLGGFHIALKELGHECVFASEIDGGLRSLYERNFDVKAAGDIREVSTAEIPPHDILCAGFPCQPFSKARQRHGSDTDELTKLYQEIVRIIDHHRPPYVIMENVPDLLSHNQGATWDAIKQRLGERGYFIPKPSCVSPHDFGIPQIRKRVYIVASLYRLEGFAWPKKVEANLVQFTSLLDESPPAAKPISASVARCLDVWQEFLDLVPKDEKIPLPLWSMEFGATYPYRNDTPYSLTTDQLRAGYAGSYGAKLYAARTRKELMALLPSHARTEQRIFPKWKINFIEKNRKFYERHKTWIQPWTEKISQFPSSFQKLEWNCQEPDPRSEDRTIYRYIIQTRPSGVRVKRPTTAPSLVAMSSTQVPIIGWEQRYMTVAECKRLQSMGEDFTLPETQTKAYAALGNAVNVEVARLVAKSLLEAA